MAYITHRREDGAYQPLKEHLHGVARKAAEFAKAFGAQDHAAFSGILHDIGKYSPNGQRRQLDPEHAPKADHSTAGAQEARRLGDLFAAFAIAGHHGGLPDMGGKADMESGTLYSRLNKPLLGPDDPSVWRGELAAPAPAVIPERVNGPFATPFYVRMLFSCLVDADYLDTEAFMTPDAVRRGAGDSLPVLLDRLARSVAPWLEAPKNELCRMRTRILSRCLLGGEDTKGLYTLTVPTGGGKTIASLAFALSHAVKHHLERVIYVVPYTSIIEQNARVFRERLGDENVLEHHSNAGFDSGEGEDAKALRRRLACENWDAPVIVTTAVQFFESIYASKTSRCRKLHNIARSVIIFDEAQMLPVAYLKPCVTAIAELVRRYGVTAVLCTATQPALDALFQEAAPGMAPRELCDEADGLFAFFRRVRFQREDTLTDEALAERLNQKRQALCIVNTRGRAKNLFALLKGEGCFHLSTLTTPHDRGLALDAIRERLERNLPCRVVATSLVEAGVDLDFPTVWRELAGLDSVLQAAGRCNREGRRSARESVVHIFKAEGRAPKMFEQNVFAMERTMKAFDELNSPEAIRYYFQSLLLTKGDAALDAHQILADCKAMKFKRVEKNFQLIDHQTVAVYIPTSENEELLSSLRRGAYSRTLTRRLGRYAVNVYPWHYQALANAGALETLAEDGAAILRDTSLYSPERGLALEPDQGMGWYA